MIEYYTFLRFIMIHITHIRKFCYKLCPTRNTSVFGAARMYGASSVWQIKSVRDIKLGKMLRNFFQKIKNKIFASFFGSQVVLELARFARGRIGYSSFNWFVLNGIPELPATLFFGIAQRMKIGNLFFLSIQPIPDLSCKFDHF